MIPSLFKTFLQKNTSTIVSMVLLLALPLLDSSSATYMPYHNQALILVRLPTITTHSYRIPSATVIAD